MSQFESDIAAWKAKRNRIIRDVHISCTEEVARSVIEGSELTGSAGQPVQLGTLRGSWVPSWLTPSTWRLVTGLIYAPPIEAGEGPYGPLTVRSPVGGFHSVEKTRTGWPNIVRHVGQRFAV